MSTKKTCTQIFMTAVFIIGPKLKTTQIPSTDGWVNKLWYMHTMEYYSAIKMGQIPKTLC